MVKSRLFSFVLSGLIVIAPYISGAQKLPSREEIAAVAYDAKGTVGVAIRHLESGKTTDYNGDKYFPMQSTFKFPIAMAVLHLVDAGKLTLDRKIKVSKVEMVKDTWSPLRDKYPDGVDATIDMLLSGMVSQSDNIACDILLRMIGGPKVADRYIKSLGIKSLDIVGTEADMHRDDKIQYRNRSTPFAMLQLLALLQDKSPLSAASTKYLLKKMKETTTGPKRLRGNLPKDAIVAHKTGTGNTYKNGVTSATNDVGIITLPNGKHIAIVVFIKDAAAKEAQREDVIARIAATAWKMAQQ